MSRSPRALRPFVRLALVVGLLAMPGCRALGPGGDPVGRDPVPYDRAHPPRIAETRIAVGGDIVNAVVYEAQGEGPHPTLVLLHGFPGFERNLDLAQAARRAGWNVVFFHYRGTWGSGGQFSFTGILEDVATVVDAVRAPDFAASHRVAPGRVALVGHSMGGFAALVSAAELDGVACVASLAGANLGASIRDAAAVEGGGEAMAARLDGWSGPVVGPGGVALARELLENAHRFDTTGHGPQLARKVVLLVAGGLDPVTDVTTHHAPLAEALRDAGAERLTTKVFAEGDHAFSGQRIALARLVVGWLDGECRAAL